MAGLERIPLRIPEEWDPVWFRRFVYETLALADTRNAQPGPGIQIIGTPDGPATISGSAAVEALTQASLVTAVAEGDLPLTRVLQGDPNVIEIVDGGPGQAIQIRFAWGIPLNRLAPVPGLSVLGAPAEGDASELEAIESSADHQVLRRVPDVDAESESDSAIDWGLLTLPMAPDNLWTYGKLQQGTGLSVLGVSGDAEANLADIVAGSDHGVFRRLGASIGFGTANVQGGGTGHVSLTGNALLVGAGTSPVNLLSPGVAGHVVRSDGTVWASSQLGFSDLAGSIADGQVPASAVTQHGAALTIDWPQLTSVPAFATRWPDWDEVTDKPPFAVVAFTGSYNDLDDTPTIPPDLSSLSFVTVGDETSAASNSRQLVAGSNIALDVDTPGQIEISATGGAGGVPSNEDLGSGTANATAFLRGDRTWTNELEGAFDSRHAGGTFLSMWRTGLGTDEGRWGLRVSSGGNFSINAVDDSNDNILTLLSTTGRDSSGFEALLINGGDAQIRIGGVTGGSPAVRVQDIGRTLIHAPDVDDIALHVGSFGTQVTGSTSGIHISAASQFTRGVRILAERRASGNDHDMIFATSAQGATPNERMRLHGDTNVLTGLVRLDLTRSAFRDHLRISRSGHSTWDITPSGDGLVFTPEGMGAYDSSQRVVIDAEERYVGPHIDSGSGWYDLGTDARRWGEAWFDGRVEAAEEFRSRHEGLTYATFWRTDQATDEGRWALRIGSGGGFTINAVSDTNANIQEVFAAFDRTASAVGVVRLQNSDNEFRIGSGGSPTLRLNNGHLNLAGGNLTVFSGRLDVQDSNFRNHLRMVRSGHGQWDITPSNDRLVFTPEGMAGYDDTYRFTIDPDAGYVGSFANSGSGTYDLGQSQRRFRDLWLSRDLHVDGDILSDSGSFSISLSGFTGSVTGTVHWIRRGSEVTFHLIANISGTSNSTSMSAGSGTVPAALRPSAGRVATAVLTDGGLTRTDGGVSVAIDGGMSFGRGGTTGGFTSSGTKGLRQGTMINYLL